ncbi:hypothetical protein [Kosakonia sp.]|nr:hypothetical protein [Kosakonia sp.]
MMTMTILAERGWVVWVMAHKVRGFLCLDMWRTLHHFRGSEPN